MNRRSNPPLTAAEIEAIEARFAMRLCSGLDEAAQAIPSDVAARLRASRERALAEARASLVRIPAQAPALAAAGNTDLGDEGASGWWRVAALLPLIVLLLGLCAVYLIDRYERINAAAEIDAALLADDLPPSAYADPGFGEFLSDAPANSPSTLP